MTKFVTSILNIIESNKFYQWIFISCTYSTDTRISNYSASSHTGTSCITPNIFAIKINYYNLFIDGFKLNLLHNCYCMIITKKIVKRILYQILNIYNLTWKEVLNLSYILKKMRNLRCKESSIGHYILECRERHLMLYLSMELKMHSIYYNLKKKLNDN